MIYAIVLPISPLHHSRVGWLAGGEMRGDHRLNGLQGSLPTVHHVHDCKCSSQLHYAEDALDAAPAFAVYMKQHMSQQLRLLVQVVCCCRSYTISTTDSRLGSKVRTVHQTFTACCWSCRCLQKAVACSQRSGRSRESKKIY